MFLNFFIQFDFSIWIWTFNIIIWCLLTLFLTRTSLFYRRLTHLWLLIQIINSIYNIIHLPLIFTLITNSCLCSLSALFVEIWGVLKKVRATVVIFMDSTIIIKRKVCGLNRFFMETLLHYTTTTKHMHTIWPSILKNILILLTGTNPISKNINFLWNHHFISDFFWHQ